MLLMFNVSDSASRNERIEDYLRGIADENMTSLRLLYEETSAGVYSFTLSMLKNREDAEDALQDVYLSIYRSAHQYTPMGRPLEWMMTITRNICLTKLRERKKRQELEREEEAIEYFDTAQSDDRIALNEALKILSDEERRIIALHSVAGLKHREIAAVLDMPPSTARSKYRRALKKLRKHLTEGGAPDEKAQR